MWMGSGFFEWKSGPLFFGFISEVPEYVNHSGFMNIQVCEFMNLYIYNLLILNYVDL